MVGEVVITPRQKLEDLIRLAELCVDLLRQNEEFYAEVTKHFRKYVLLFFRPTIRSLQPCDKKTFKNFFTIEKSSQNYLDDV